MTPPFADDLFIDGMPAGLQQPSLRDLVGHLGRPDANSRRISRQLLVRLDAMDGVTLYGWMAKLSQIQCLYRTRNGNAVDQTVGRCLAQFMVQWLDAKGPWRALGLDDHHPLAMAMAQHPRVRREGLLDGLRQAASSLRERTTGRWPGPWPPVDGLPPALVQERSHQPVRRL